MSKYSLQRNSGKKKNKDKKNDRNRMAFEQTKIVNKATDKHGRLKFKKLSGKQRKELMSQCTHHVIGKNGKPRNFIIDNRDGTCTCRMCGQRFNSKGLVKEDLKKAIEPIVGNLQHDKYILQAYGGDPKTMDVLAETNYLLIKYPAISDRIDQACRRMQKKGKKKNNDYQSTRPGSWIDA